MASSTSRLRWSRPDQFLNSWTNADADQPVEFAQDSDNIVHLRGILSGGTSGTAAFYLPEYMRPRRDTVYLPSLFSDGSSYITVATTGAVTPYNLNLRPHYTVPKIAAYWPAFHLNANAGHAAGNGAYATMPSGWALFDNPSITGYNREYRATVQYQYAPAGGTTDSNLTIRTSGAGSTWFYIPSGAKNVTADYTQQTSWATDTTVDGWVGTSRYLEAMGNWSTAVGNYYIRYFLIHVRYATTTSYFYLDGLNFHPAI